MEVLRNFDILDSALERVPLDVALAAKENGKWVTYSTQAYKETVTQLSYGLIQLGLKPGDKVATITNNRPEWNFVNYAVAQVGGIICPVYPTISESDYNYIFNDAGIRYVFLSDMDLLTKIESIKDKVPSLEGIFTFNQIPGQAHWSQLLHSGRENPNEEELARRKASIQHEDLATIIYTSGTTGNPKGVMLSHKNLVSNAISSQPLLPVGYGDRALSFLPLCHVFERTLLNIYTYAGISIYYAESLDTIGDNIREVKPHVFTAVPRLIEKVYDKIIAGGGQKSGIIKKLFFWAVKKAQGFDVGNSKGLGDLVADKLVYSKIRANLGGEVRAIVSGSAALQTRLAKFFWGIGIPVLEGYGLTETSPIVSVNTLLPGGTKFGTIGKLLDGVQVKIADDGEILVNGPNVMMGYYKNDEATHSAISEGWFHTGDIGEFDGPYLKITDRKKEMFKTSGGKYVAPQPIENKMKESLFIEQIMVIGEGKKHPAALIVPAFEYVKGWAKTQGISANSNSELVKNEALQKVIAKEVARLNESFGKVEQVKKFELLEKEWSIEGGELTPTLKLKRKVIKEKFQHLYTKIYGE